MGPAARPANPGEPSCPSRFSLTETDKMRVRGFAWRRNPALRVWRSDGAASSSWSIDVAASPHHATRCYTDCSYQLASLASVITSSKDAWGISSPGCRLLVMQEVIGGCHRMQQRSQWRLPGCI